MTELSALAGSEGYAACDDDDGEFFDSKLPLHVLHLVEAHEDGGALGAGGGALRYQGGVRHAGDDAFIYRPAHGGLRPVADAVGIGVRAQADRALGLAGVAPQHGDHLLAGNEAVRVGAVADALGHRPVAGLLSPVRSGYRRAVDAAEDCPEHRAGHRAVGVEGGGAVALHHAVGVHVGHGVVEPLPGAHVGEGQRVAVSEGHTHGHVAGGHLEGVGRGVHAHDVNAAVGAGNGNARHAVAAVGRRGDGDGAARAGVAQAGVDLSVRRVGYLDVIGIRDVDGAPDGGEGQIPAGGA